MVQSVMAPMMKETVTNTHTDSYLVEHTGDTRSHGLLNWFVPFIHLHGPSAALTSPLVTVRTPVSVVMFFVPSSRAVILTLGVALSLRLVIIRKDGITCITARDMAMLAVARKSHQKPKPKPASR